MQQIIGTQLSQYTLQAGLVRSEQEELAPEALRSLSIVLFLDFTLSSMLQLATSGRITLNRLW